MLCNYAVLFLIYYYAECHYAQCRYAECCYAKCHYAEGRTTFKSLNTFVAYLHVQFVSAILKCDAIWTGLMSVMINIFAIYCVVLKN